MGGRCGGMGSVDSAEELRERMDRPAGWMLNKVDASEAQEGQIEAVLDRTAPVLYGLKDDHEALRERLHAALTAPAVNTAEVERVRLDGLQLADDASRIVLGAVVEIAGVLDAEQRAELAELAERHHR